jgi:hypothetical protein
MFRLPFPPSSPGSTYHVALVARAPLRRGPSRSSAQASRRASQPSNDDNTPYTRHIFITLSVTLRVLPGHTNSIYLRSISPQETGRDLRTTLPPASGHHVPRSSSARRHGCRPHIARTAQPHSCGLDAWPRASMVFYPPVHSLSPVTLRHASEPW